jgi:hypothetical protein
MQGAGVLPCCQAHTTDVPTLPVACPLTTCHDRYQRLSCSRCNRTFDAASNYLDLTLTSGVSQTVFKQRLWRGTELFRWVNRDT